MGFRLNIETEDKELFGDDHKLYGYWRYEEVKDSFMVLYPLIQEQWSIPANESPEDVYNMYFFSAAVTDNLTVSNDVFEVFARKYIMDLVRTSHTPESVAIVALYLARLRYEYPGDKILYWL